MKFMENPLIKRIIVRKEKAPQLDVEGRELGKLARLDMLKTLK